MTDPREDALAKAREALTWYAIQVAGCRKMTGEGEDARRALDRDGGQQATEALAALSATPSQSESDDEKLIEAMANEFVGHIAAGRSSHVAMRFTLAFARKALTPSPTPYVRPAAEIQAEIERNRLLLNIQSHHVLPEDVAREWRRLSDTTKAYIAGLTFALTPPTTEQERR